MLATLGAFPFNMSTIPYQSISRQNAWRHPTQSTVGTFANPSQFTGKDNETISIKGELRPEITGGLMSIKALKIMADSGIAWPFILGNGMIQGFYTINGISEDMSVLDGFGNPAAISFSMELVLKEDPMADWGDKAIGIMRETINKALG